MSEASPPVKKKAVRYTDDDIKDAWAIVVLEGGNLSAARRRMQREWDKPVPAWSTLYSWVNEDNNAYRALQGFRKRSIADRWSGILDMGLAALGDKAEWVRYKVGFRDLITLSGVATDKFLDLVDGRSSINVKQSTGIQVVVSDDDVGIRLKAPEQKALAPPGSPS